jgi:hypothetical protein
MLSDAFPFLLPSNIKSDLPGKVRRLGDDLERIRSGAGPTDAEIAAAPLIEEWYAVLTPTGLRLAGVVSRHPLFGNGTTVISQVWAADAGGRWVRTISRFYRLGRAAAGNIAAETGRRRRSATAVEGILRDV